jgi:hypothetical protein
VRLGKMARCDGTLMNPAMFKQHAIFGMLVSAALGIPYVASEWRSLTDWMTAPGYSNPRTSSEGLELQGDYQRTAALLNGDNAQPRLQTQSSPVGNQSSWFRTISDSNSSTVEDMSQDAIRAREELSREMLEQARAGAYPNPSGTAAREISNSGTTKDVSSSNMAGFRPDAPIPGPKFTELGLVHLHEALNLQVTEQFVINRWPRVNTGLMDKDLRGFRVPYLSGSNEDDPAGALTYYFNKNHTCEKLTFSGTVGDPRKLVMYLVQSHGFEPQPSPEAGVHLYQIRAGKQNSELTIKPAPVVRSNTPHLRYQVELLISR